MSSQQSSVAVPVSRSYVVFRRQPSHSTRWDVVSGEEQVKLRVGSKWHAIDLPRDGSNGETNGSLHEKGGPLLIHLSIDRSQSRAAKL